MVSAPEPERETLLQRKLREGEFVVSVEIDPPRGGNAHAMLELTRSLKASGHVDVVYSQLSTFSSLTGVPCEAEP